MIICSLGSIYDADGVLLFQSLADITMGRRFAVSLVTTHTHTHPPPSVTKTADQFVTNSFLHIWHQFVSWRPQLFQRIVCLIPRLSVRNHKVKTRKKLMPASKKWKPEGRPLNMFWKVAGTEEWKYKNKTRKQISRWPVVVTHIFRKFWPQFVGWIPQLGQRIVCRIPRLERR